jgi:hypothetical protein
MKWYRSEADKSLQTIQHFYSCTRCGSVDRVSTVAPMTDRDPNAGDEVLDTFRCDWLD